jgi:tetratricopeptide (TPR) repeat protein
MSLKTQRLLSRAKKLVKKSEIKKARDLYVSILSNDPVNQEAKKGLLSLDNIQIIKPSRNELDNIMKLYSSGLFLEALSSINLLISEYPNESLLFNISGACYSETNQINLAIEKFQQAIKIKPDYAEAYYNLGVAYQKNDHLNDALNNYEKAIELKHSYPQAHNNVGLINLNIGKLDLAVTSLEWAVAYSPNYAEAHNNLGAAFLEQMLYEKAMEQYEKAININPSYAIALNNLGISCEVMGLRDNARINYDKAILINPNYSEAHRNLSSIKTYTEKDSQVIQMESLYLNDNLCSADKINLTFALARVHEDLKNTKDFFKYLNEGNKLRRKELNYSFESSKKLQGALINVSKLSSVISNSSISKSPIKKRPIFIIGMPRSGSTLVEQIISNHNKVYGAGELNNFKSVINPLLENIINGNSEKLSNNDLLSIRKEYLSSLAHLSIKEAIFTDKMPLNFEYIGFIIKAFPEAKILHIKRDARAVCFSIYKNYFSSKGISWGYDMIDLVSFYGLYTETMEKWHKLFPNKIYDISYEKLTTNQKTETEKILKFCDLDWYKNCINFHKNTRAVKTASHSQVRRKMYQGSSEVWKQYKSYLQPLIDGLKPY